MPESFHSDNVAVNWSVILTAPKMNTPENPAPPPAPPPLLLQAVEASAPPRLPWGFWATGGLGAVLICAYMTAQVIALVLYMVGALVLRGGKSFPSLEALTTNGTVFSLSVILGGPVTILLCGLFAWLRKGPAIPSYLGLYWPKPRVVVWWSLGLLLLWAGSDALTLALDRPVVPDVMAEIYWNTGFRPFIWITLIIAGPATEEFVFRGFLFRGWQESRLGGWGTIFLTSLLWAVIHLQYDLYGIASIFVAGLFLGLVRLKTGSVLFCTFLHSVINLIATIQIEFFTTPA